MDILFLNIKISSTPKEKYFALSVSNKLKMFFNFESSNYFYLTKAIWRYRNLQIQTPGIFDQF